MKKESALLNENQNLRRLLASIVIDVDAMRCARPHWVEDIDDDHWFGPIGGTVNVEFGGIYVQWPNLSILIEQAKKLGEKK